MKGRLQTGTIKIWFGLLKVAISQGLPINDAFYRSWGTRDELARLTFNGWWTKRGRQLFLESIPAISLVEAYPDHITVKIPTSLTAVQVKKQIAELVTKTRGTKRLKVKPPLAFVGDVNYKRLKQYERYLLIEFDPRNSGKTIEEKSELLRKVYTRIKERLDKQKKTLMAHKQKKVALRLFYRDPDSLGSRREIRDGIDAKKVNRWKLSGKILLLNVAEGSFPGHGYYGPQLAKRLRQRLHRLGLEDIGGPLRNKGGGRKKEELTLVRVRKSKAEAGTLALKAYGKGRHSNPIGNIEEEMS